MKESSGTQAHSIRGFGRAPSAITDWLPDGPGLRLPSPRAEEIGACLPPVALLLDPESPPEWILIDGWVEGFGNFEARLREFAEALPEGGRLVLDLWHMMAPSAVRKSFEGRVSGLDSRPAPFEREVPLDLDRVASSLPRAGFVILDLFHVAAWDGPLPRKALKPLVDAGLAATELMYRRPGERLWVLAERRVPLGGSVLIADPEKSDEAVARTRAALCRFLPEAWEIVTATPGLPCLRAWNESLRRSSGDACWLLRAGDLPERGDFERLIAEADPRPSVPEDPDGTLRQGLGGMIVPRRAWLRIGPLPEEIDSEIVAGEEWILRASACGLPVVECRLDRPFDGRGPSEGTRDAEEARALFERWEGIESLPNPGEAMAADLPPPPWEREGREPRISLCMIARNEEAFLDGCLSRVRPFVDEIILVDTGSTDRTMEIAKSHGATVLQRPWDEDFSAPRNLAISRAGGDWILVLDADEYVEPDSLPRLREIARNGRASGYQMLFRNDFEEGRTRGVMMVRMFRNLPGLQYRYRIHEQAIPSLVSAAEPLGLDLHPSDVVIVHYGYSEAVIESRRKIERNLRLFRLQLEEYPEDVYCLYKYGDFLRQIEKPPEEIIEVLSKAYRLATVQPPSKWRQMPFAGEICALLGLELAKKDRPEEADRILRTGLARFMPTPNLHYIAAGVASHFERFEEALEHYERLLAFRGVNLVVPVQEGITSWIALVGMASCWIGKGNLERARELLGRAMDAAPEEAVPHLVLSGLEIRNGKPREALEILIRYLEAWGEHGPVRLQGGLILARLGLVDQARAWLAKALEAGGVDEDSVRRHAAALKLAVDSARTPRERDSWSDVIEEPLRTAVRN